MFVRSMLMLRFYARVSHLHTEWAYMMAEKKRLVHRETCICDTHKTYTDFPIFPQLNGL